MSIKRDPETYLKIAQAEERRSQYGRLKIYLGAAPGVGKTYQMLSDGLTLRSQGFDVVIGDVATHGRQEVESLASAFEKLPLLPVKIEETIVYALDLDAIIKRAPGLVLIDEAAFSNPKGLRHPKRWQDILELIKHGINVYTTLNVQHIESLNDVVSNLIGVPIFETVPDDFLEQADEMELVDLPSEELIQRLKQGKVYVPSEISIAMDYFFKKNHLDALRELALRIVAERVSGQVDSEYAKSLSAQLMYKQDNLLICIKNDPAMPKLIRVAKRLSMRLKCKWMALFVDDGQQTEFLKVQEYLALAESLGAKTQVVSSTHFLQAIEQFVISNQITQIVIGRTRRKWWSFRTKFDLISHHFKDIGLYGVELTKPGQQVFSWKKSRWWLALPMALIVGAIYLIYPTFNPWNLLLCFAIYVFILASVEEWEKVLLITFLFLGIDILINEQSILFMLEPTWELFVHYSHWSILGLIFSLGLVYSSRRIRQAREIEENNGFLMGFYQAISSIRGRDKIVQTAYDYFKQHLNLEVKVFLPYQQSLQLFLPKESRSIIDDKEMAIVQWVFQSGNPAGRGTGNLIFSEGLFLPLKGVEACQGVMRFQSISKDSLSNVQRKNLQVCLQQLANILEIESQYEQAKAKDISLVKNKVKDDLLSGFTAQLYKPFLHLLDLLPKELENSPYRQLLHRLSNHLRVMSYFGDQALLKQVTFQSMPELINQVLTQRTKPWDQMKVGWYVQADLPKVWMQLDLMTVVIENILDNILQHANIKDGVEISIHQKKGFILVSFADFGPGFNEKELSKVFDYFYQVNATLSSDGLGLGLALCERIISWHGGKIWAENRYPRGAIFNFLLPLENPSLKEDNK